jgi:phenylalanyl-tRNA synthetase beta subunit
MKFWNILSNNYFYEVQTHNLVDSVSINKFNLFNYKENIKIISSNQSRQWFRNNLIDAMLKIYSYNVKRKIELLPIYEYQKIYQLNSKPDWNLTLLSPKEYVID